VVAQLRQRAVEFDAEGYMRRREASINDLAISEDER
jgi:nuclear transport factor 2 (NTF2) superfamily protein